MSYFTVKAFVEHILKSKQFRKKYSADILLDFHNYCHKKTDKDRTSYTTGYRHSKISLLLDELREDNTLFSKDFYNDLINELSEMKKKRKEEQCIVIAKLELSAATQRTELHDYVSKLFRNYSITISYSIDNVSKLWDCMNDDEKSVWIKPSNQGNPYTKWISIYKNKVLEVYPNTKDKQLYSLMGSIWTSIKGNIKYAELREYTYDAPYMKYTEDEKIVAHNLNTYLIKELMNKDRDELEIMKKYIHMKRFIKLCKSEEFNKYFWDPKNMGGKWHINKMEKMCSEL